MGWSDNLRERVREHVRVIWAIAAKDIVDAVKTRAILPAILLMSFLMVLIKVMPSLSAEAHPPRLAIYDAGSSDLLARLELDPKIDLHQAPSQQELDYYLGLLDAVVLGLVLPPDFDRAVETSEQLELDGYVDHWVSESVIAETRSFFEEKLSELTSKPVHINVQSDTVYTHAEGLHPYTVSTVMTILLTILGLTCAPQLMIEEKQSKTLDALLVSPATSSQIVIGKAIMATVYSLAGAAVVLAFNTALIVHWGVAVLAVIVGASFAIASGLLIGSVVTVKQQLRMWMVILVQPLVIPTALPPELLPDNVETILSAIPTVALARVFRLAFLESAPFPQFGPLLAYVAGCTALVLATVVWIVRQSDR